MTAVNVTIMVHSRQDEKSQQGNPFDPLHREKISKQPAMIAVKWSDPEDYDHVRWTVPQGDDYDGTIYDNVRGTWVEGPPPARQWGFILGESTIQALGLILKEQNGLPNIRHVEAELLIEGARARTQ